jgi:hypothetical protein
MVYATIECWGGGGSGGSIVGPGVGKFNGAGGGAGEYARKTVSAATVGSSQTVTIGAGGVAPAAGNNNGNAGNN